MHTWALATLEVVNRRCTGESRAGTSLNARGSRRAAMQRTDMANIFKKGEINKRPNVQGGEDQTA